MLSTLRKIRHSIVNSGSASRYLFYALGEILLVVIGILIALQINNWNEGRKAALLERSTLIELNNSIQSDVKNFAEVINTQLHLAEVSKVLLDHLKEQKPYDPMLDTLWEKTVRFFALSFNNSAFELLESRGIDLISNVDLRNRIVHHFNFEQSRIRHSLDINYRVSEQFLFYFFDRLYNPISSDFSEEFDYRNEILVPVDYQSLLNDPVVIPKISHSIKTRYRMIKIVKGYISSQRKLVTEIEKELNRGNK